MTLMELMLTGRYPTDKEVINGQGRHCYISHFYEEAFKPYQHKPISLLEIGVYHGDSLRLWADYFDRADIIGLDRDKDVFQGARHGFSGKTFSVYFDDATLVSKFFGSFDIIIDDGDHHPDTQQKCLELYLSHLKPGGLYVVEDVQHAVHYPQLTLGVAPEWRAYIEHHDFMEVNNAFDDRLFVVRKP